jgi:hypothetical protein
MRAIWTVVVALCLAAASAGRPPRIEVGSDHRAAQQLAAAPDAVPAVALRRRAVALPDGLSTPGSILVSVLPPAPPRVAILCSTDAPLARPVTSLVSPRSSRGPPG